MGIASTLFGALGIRSNATAMFTGSGTNADWRLRLNIPDIDVYKTDSFMPDVFTPLRLGGDDPMWAAGSLVFPYTPEVNFESTANYEETPLTHQNFVINSYKNSKNSDIRINAPFMVENPLQASYWIAAYHFLKSATKMFTGENTGKFAGAPPPILSLNGYGDHIFKNVPVVVTSFSVTLPSDENYISSFGLKIAGISATNISHVPVKSSFSVSLRTMYSREAISKFDLKDFADGKYLDGSGGYI